LAPFISIFDIVIARNAYVLPVYSVGVSSPRPLGHELFALTSRPAVPNLIINWANIGDRKSWRANLYGKIARGGDPPILGFIAFLLRSVLKFTCGGPK
jgi:hypothetical protein